MAEKALGESERCDIEGQLANFRASENSLEIELRRAQERFTQQELALVEYENQIEDLEEEIRRRDLDNDSESEVSKIAGELKDVKHALSVSESERIRLEAELEDMRQIYQSVREAHSRLQKESDERIDQLESRVVAQDNELEEYRANERRLLDQAERDISKVRSGQEQLRMELEHRIRTQDQDIEEYKAQLDSCQHAVRDLEQRFEEQSRALKAKESTVLAEEAHVVADLREEVSQLQRLNQSVELEKRELHVKLVFFENQVTEMTRDREQRTRDMDERVVSRDTKINQLVNEIGLLKEENERHRRLYEELESDHVELQRRYEDCLRGHGDLTDQIRGLTRDRQSAEGREAELKRVRERVGELEEEVRLQTE
eukprot:gene5220-6661_t